MRARHIIKNKKIQRGSKRVCVYDYDSRKERDRETEREREREREREICWDGSVKRKSVVVNKL